MRLFLAVACALCSGVHAFVPSIGLAQASRLRYDRALATHNQPKSQPRFQRCQPKTPLQEESLFTSTTHALCRRAATPLFGARESEPALAGTSAITSSSSCANSQWHWICETGNKLIQNGFSSGLLVACTIASLLLANLPYTSAAWVSLWELPLPPSVGGHVLTLRSWVNEGLMCFFFFGVGLEIKKEVIHGSLSSPQTAGLPCVAAAGGMLVPMCVYWLINRVWPHGSMAAVTVPMATDIAFALGVYGFFKDRLPTCAMTFLLTLATVDDLGAIIVIATLFASNIVPSFLLWALSAVFSLGVLERSGVQSGLPYLGVGLVLWLCLLQGGINADIAGVLAAMAVPAHKTIRKIADTSSPLNFFSKNFPILFSVTREPSMERIEQLIFKWAPINALFIMPLFALANTGIPLLQVAGASSLPLSVAPVSLGISMGLFLGKPIGIFGFSLLAIKLGLCKFPDLMTKRHLATVGVLGSIGFTMSLFLVDNCLSGILATYAKLAVLTASTAGALFASVLMSRYPRFVSTTTSKSATDAASPSQPAAAPRT